MHNLRIFFNNLQQNKPLFITIIVIVVLIILFLFSLLFRTLTNEDRVYNDPLSKEVIYNPKDRTPESYGQSNQVSYLGFSELIDRGISFDNVQLFKKELEPIKVKGEKVTEISIDIESVKHLIDTESDIYEFRIRFNRQYDYQTTLKISKNTDSLTFNFSGDTVENITFD